MNSWATRGTASGVVCLSAAIGAILSGSPRLAVQAPGAGDPPRTRSQPSPVEHNSGVPHPCSSVLLGGTPGPPALVHQQARPTRTPHADRAAGLGSLPHDGDLSPSYRMLIRRETSAAARRTSGARCSGPSRIGGPPLESGPSRLPAATQNPPAHTAI